MKVKQTVIVKYDYSNEITEEVYNEITANINDKKFVKRWENEMKEDMGANNLSVIEVKIEIIK